MVNHVILLVIFEPILLKLCTVSENGDELRLVSNYRHKEIWLIKHNWLGKTYFIFTHFYIVYFMAGSLIIIFNYFDGLLNLYPAIGSLSLIHNLLLKLKAFSTKRFTVWLCTELDHGL